LLYRCAKENPMNTQRIPAFLAAALLAACGQVNDADRVAEAIEQENGGLDMEPEAPMFGVDDEFAEANRRRTSSRAAWSPTTSPRTSRPWPGATSRARWSPR
jgi:hypothetical protein